MTSKEKLFLTALEKCESIVAGLGFEIEYTFNLNRFFKGDLDGRKIYIGAHISVEEKLFNLLHLAGHSIQWNVSKLLRELGSELYQNPSDQLIKKLQRYEWQANCYGLYILHKAGIHSLDKWLTGEYVQDMLYLTHFYKTGQKLKRITKVAKAYPFERALKPLRIPKFTPVSEKRTRNGIVISF